MEGPARGIPLVLDLLAPAQGLGARRRVDADLAAAPAVLEQTPADQVGRVLRRRQLRPGKKGGLWVGKTKRGKGTKWMVVVDGEGLPLGVHLCSASPNEVTLIEPVLDAIALPQGQRRVRRLIYDKAADSDPLRQRLLTGGIQLICPHRTNRTKPRIQDGRSLRRYARRWKVERTLAWLGNFRRLVVRYEHQALMYQAFFHVACVLITLRWF